MFLWPERDFSTLASGFYLGTFFVFHCQSLFYLYFYVLNFPSFSVFLFLFSLWWLFSLLIVGCCSFVPLDLRSCMVIDCINSKFGAESGQCSNWKGMPALGMFASRGLIGILSMRWLCSHQGNPLDEVVMLCCGFFFFFVFWVCT